MEGMRGAGIKTQEAKTAQGKPDAFAEEGALTPT